jgi:hypothetical protein
MRLRLLSLVLILGSLGLAAPASALVLQRFTLADLVTRSVAVVCGVVRGSEARWNADHSRIHTTWRVEVAEPVYGAERGQVLDVLTLGGRVGDAHMHLSGNVRLTEGEEVVLFLVPNGAAFSVAGMTQGKFSVVRDPSGGSPRLTRDAPSARDGLPDAPTLDELIARVRLLRKEVTR